MVVVTDEKPEPQPESLLGVGYPDTPDVFLERCEECGQEFDDWGQCGCADEPWHDEDKGWE